MAQGLRSRQSLYYVAEVTPGTTPSTPTMIEIPIAGVPTLAVQKDNFRSNRINANRQTATIRHGVRRSAGDIPIELAYGDFDTLFESLMHSSWSTNVLKVGTTQKFFTLERRFPDISEYQPFTGCMMNSFTFSARPNGMITGSFGVLGLGGMTEASSSAANADTAADGNEPFDGFSGSITEGGSAANITALDLTVTNNGALPYKIGSDTSPRVNSGTVQITGTATAFFESEALINKFLAETESAIAVTFSGITGGDLEFELPALKYTGSTITDADEGLLVELPFEAYYDAGDSTSLTITRTPAS